MVSAWGDPSTSAICFLWVMRSRHPGCLEASAPSSQEMGPLLTSRCAHGSHVVTETLDFLQLVIVPFQGQVDLSNFFHGRALAFIHCPLSLSQGAEGLGVELGLFICF